MPIRFSPVPLLRGLAMLAIPFSALGANPLFRAGTAVADISPTNFPVIVNAMFTERSASKVVDPLHTRALVLDNGSTKLALALVDTCMMPRDLIDRAKTLAQNQTGIPTEAMLVSATHTHSAPAAMGCLGSRADTNYAALLPGKIAHAIAQANSALQPASIGWAVVDDWDHTFNRRWIRRPDRVMEDPFGRRTVRAHMHPGHESQEVTGPSGPVDPALSVIGLRSADGKPLALLANYSQHYYGSDLLSSDYFGRFAAHVAGLLGETNPSFMAAMSQGTSGDLMWMDYSAPRSDIGYDAYAREVAERAHQAWQKIQFTNWVILRSVQTNLTLKYRVPDSARLDWARATADQISGRLPRTLPEIYALEAIHLHERQRTDLLLQALRIGDAGIAALPNEVYALTGLKVKARSPFPITINVELANGAEGYIPPREQHFLGGYTTWPARTAGLEIGAEEKIVETLLALLHKLNPADQRTAASQSLYARTIVGSEPAAYFRFDEMQGASAFNSALSGVTVPAVFEPGIAFYLPGAGSGEGFSPEPALTPSNFSDGPSINRSVHFAGGRVAAKLPLGDAYSVSFWFWNGLESSAREVTGVLFSRGSSSELEGGGDYLALGGAADSNASGRLIFSNGSTQVLAGTREIPLRHWHHCALVRDGERIAIYLDGKLEISGEAPNLAKADPALWIGGRNDNFANFEGKIDEFAIYTRPLESVEIQDQLTAARRVE